MNLQKYFYLLLLIGLSLILSCSPKGGYKVLSYFVDGVPDSLKYPENKTISQNVPQDTVVNTTLEPSVFKADYCYHAPYKKQVCTACHDKTVRSSIILKQPALCYQCHADFQKTLSYVHGPVAGGYCTSCHAPHMSQYPKLLLLQGQQLCLQCHSSTDVLNNLVHKDLGNRDCMNCHLPHGSNKRYFLK